MRKIEKKLKNISAKNGVLRFNKISSIKLFGTKEQITFEVNNILQTFKDHPFIFNLGHGILTATTIENVELLLELVKK